MSAANPGGMDRWTYEMAVQRDRLVQIRSVHNDMALGLPYSVPLPDGERYRCGNTDTHKMRDSQQVSTTNPSMDRWTHAMAVQRDRLVQVRSVHNDITLGLPYSVALPHGEGSRRGNASELKIRDSQQQSEIPRRCIRPPPNKTVFDAKSPPHRPISAGLPSEWPSGSSGSNPAGPSRTVSRASTKGPAKGPASIFGRTVKCLSGKGSFTSEASSGS